MTSFYESLKAELSEIVQEWSTGEYLREALPFVIGCSTSEIAGERIGTSGSEAIAEEVFMSVKDLQAKTGIVPVFQCCEHLNRALVMEREVMERLQLEEVSVVPVKTAGGAMATYAFQHFQNPVVVETIQAHAGMDIGETMIGMHLKHVAVPLRFKQRFVGKARVTTAITRPKLIGGQRAQYERIQANTSCK
ncbi:TIGR01440 family protein [Oceanobacillus manasiensis]|uniref:TIGR01440 family protein n=1 Tax=Oceanobacillus manasiensis TaxID=586413 RepID=UPI0005A79AE2|nr:TIGR01440 family protein [Oceanobacillus manasiensis]